MRLLAATFFSLYCLLWKGYVCTTENLTEPDNTAEKAADCARIVKEEDYLKNVTRDLASYLVKWPLLKRQAGYLTESHVYRGGLYKEAVDEEYEFYQCLHFDEKECTLWTAHEKSKDEVEQGMCHCTEWEEHYCKSWECHQTEIAFDANCGDSGCSDEVQYENTTCACKIEYPNGKYCEKWNYTENGSDGNHEEEDYTSLEHDGSETYCSFWTGNVTSETEIESSACECVCKGDQFCTYWICKELGIERCTAHRGWCSIDVALGVGGGFGAAFMLVSLGLVPPNAKRHERIFSLILAFLFGCLPWTAGVVIWGGLRALPWVALIWASTFILSLTFIYFVTREPSSTGKDVAAPEGQLGDVELAEE